MEYKIEKDINLPSPMTDGKYPFGQMEVGDSFIIGEYSRLNMNKFSNAGRNYKSKSKGKQDWKFSTRKEGNMVRIWRVK